MKTPASTDVRLAEKVWDFYTGKHRDVVEWLVKLGCKVINVTETGEQFEYLIDGLAGVRSALLYPGLDPNGIAVTIGFLVGGQLWPVAYPDFLNLVTARWRAQINPRKTQFLFNPEQQP